MTIQQVSHNILIQKIIIKFNKLTEGNFEDVALSLVFN